jgi:hypothetical protein
MRSIHECASVDRAESKHNDPFLALRFQASMEERIYESEERDDSFTLVSHGLPYTGSEFDGKSNRSQGIGWETSLSDGELANNL